MTPSIIRDQLDSALGMTLAAADARTYKIDGGMAAHPDIGEVVLSFAPSTKLYLSWEQRGEWHELSVRGSSHLLPDSFAGGTPEMEGVLSEAMGKPFTHYEIYADDEHSLAVRLTFQTSVTAIAVGHETWNATEQRGEFRNFSGDDLFLWSDETFTSLAAGQDLRKVSENSTVARL